MLNMNWNTFAFELPTVTGRKWFRAVDTSLASPLDIANPGEEIAIDGHNYLVNGRSIVVLLSK
jgi:isoamylase